ncbi:MAG: hypothetical protein QOI83_3970 [Streptomycetaceae bacterium]|jgi:hypothetical protein|nr:hypothetical protein [Streptomycetaceae bacterium]
MMALGHPGLAPFFRGATPRTPAHKSPAVRTAHYLEVS